MWARWCADPAPILAGHVAGADLLFGNHRDIGLMLGRDFDGESPEGRQGGGVGRLRDIPGAASDRLDGTPDALTGSQPDARAIDTPDASHETGEIDIPGIVDRIGTGDAFAAGVLAGLDDGLETAARMGLHLAVLKHATPGDQSRTRRRDLDAFDPPPGWTYGVRWTGMGADLMAGANKACEDEETCAGSDSG